MSALPLSHMPLTSLKGVGPKMAERLEKLGLASVQDLLFHLPLRYEDRTRVYPIAGLMPGIHCAVQGEVLDSQILFGKRRMMVCRIDDGTGVLTLRFFHFSAAQKNQLTQGKVLRCYGEIKRGARGPEIIHPEYKAVSGEAQTSLEENLTPVYPTTEGLKQLSLRQLTEQALSKLRLGRVEELLPEGLYAGQMPLAEALQTLHRPPVDVSLEALEAGEHPAQQRLIMEELLAHNLSMLELRHNTTQDAAFAIPAAHGLVDRFISTLPFSPTGAQQRVVGEIQTDMARPHPMMRLVQGDVGSGKTLVAVLAALSAIDAGHQVALMAPTEILAEQHSINFHNWLAPLGLKVAWLAGKTKGKAREAALSAIADGSAHMVVGTHAIFQEQVHFHSLSLAIIDEQHRFGVHQRLALREKGMQQGKLPHQLIMTATPIPRTLAMTAYADLDTSIIDELPPGRTPVTTVAMPDTRRDEIIARVNQAITQDKRQVYWVCTLIEESEMLQCQAAEDAALYLTQSLPEVRIGLVHGRMKPSEKQAVMEQFKAAELDLLVATTVIEVGVDVPNASLMIIENPERLGLAQLHQLRGRVGRGAIASHCLLMYASPLSHTATKRLGVLRDTNDGFKIAQQDLEIRGPGEVLGTRQTGLADMKIADLVRDAKYIPQVQQLARHIWQQHNDHAKPLILRWLGERSQFSHA